MFIQYERTPFWDSSLSIIGKNELGLATCGVKKTAGAPTAIAGRWAAGATVINSADSITYRNAGTTASNSWVNAATPASNSITTTMLQAGAVTKAKLATGVKATYMSMFASASVTTVGGAAAEAITITGVASGDIAVVSLLNSGTNAVKIVSVACTTDTLTVTFSADPGNDAKIAYNILRATA